MRKIGWLHAGLAGLILALLAGGIAVASGRSTTSPSPAVRMPHRSHMWDGNKRGMHSELHAMKREMLLAVAAKLGMTKGALLESLRSGKTVADVARAKGVSLATLGAAVAANVKPVLDRLVKDGALSQERATTLLAAIRSGAIFEHRFGRHTRFKPAA